MGKKYTFISLKIMSDNHFKDRISVSALSTLRKLDVAFVENWILILVLLLVSAL